MAKTAREKDYPKTDYIYDKDRAKRLDKDADYTKSAKDKKYDRTRAEHYRKDEKYAKAKSELHVHVHLGADKKSPAKKKSEAERSGGADTVIPRGNADGDLREAINKAKGGW